MDLPNIWFIAIFRAQQLKRLARNSDVQTLVGSLVITHPFLAHFPGMISPWKSKRPCSISITDFEKSLDFYMHTVGFSVVYQREEEDFAFLSLCRGKPR
ncbi:hypothetical protein [Dictyobacter halimunensis]|uniref:hypothetical protein n=1 Tax=Dictyobacter halimunensis TaxID=3026934 RepID=UPI0030C68C62